MKPLPQPPPSSREPTVCDRVRAHVYPFLDHELSPQAEIAIRCHLRSCVSCRQYFDSERRYLDALHCALKPHSTAAPPHLKKRILRLLRQLRGTN